MKVRFYSFTKRKNSTLQPSGTYTETECYLKENTSMHDPTLVIAGAPNPSYTYAYIPDWEKYYYVQDEVSVANGITEYMLSEDAMASNKAAIGASDARILYCTDSTYKDITDPRLLTKSTKTVMGSGDFDTPIFDSNGCYVLTVLDSLNTASPGDHGGIGCGTVYLLNQSGMNSLRKWLNTTGVLSAILTFFNGNLSSGILGCVWVPFPYASYTGYTTSRTQIVIGERQSYGNDGITINCEECNSFFTYPDSLHIACNLRYPVTDFRAANPYTTGCIYLPGVGNVGLNMSHWLGSTKINVSVTREVITGNVSYILFDDNGALIQSASCNVASQIPIGQLVQPAEKVVNSLVGFAGGAAAAVGGDPSGAGVAIGSIVNLALSANQTAASISGSIGGRTATLWPYVTHVEYSVDTQDPDAALYLSLKGRPFGECDLISNHSGYIQCENASVLMAGNENERREIESIMNAGFFYE